MANIGHKQKFNEHKIQIICSANKLFLQKGFYYKMQQVQE